VTRRLRFGVGRGDRLAVVVMVITIFAIAGTLSSCGRYGPPVRAVPVAETSTSPEAEEIAPTEGGVLDEPSNWTAEPIESEESDEFEEFEELEE
jgi:hypothetical protein